MSWLGLGLPCPCQAPHGTTTRSAIVLPPHHSPPPPPGAAPVGLGPPGQNARSSWGAVTGAAAPRLQQRLPESMPCCLVGEGTREEVSLLGVPSEAADGATGKGGTGVLPLDRRRVHVPGLGEAGSAGNGAHGAGQEGAKVAPKYFPMHRGALGAQVPPGGARNGVHPYRALTRGSSDTSRS